MMNGDKIKIDIAMCTFRRESVVDTLNSLRNLELDSHWQVNIIVADNDVELSDRRRVMLVDQTNIPVIYVHAPQSNISIARNACLSTSDIQWLAFIDDDELADPGWLRALMHQAFVSKAFIVLGPVNAKYDPKFCENWMGKGDFYKTRSVYVKNKIVTGYICNVLLDRRDQRFRDFRFDLAHGKTGGEDSVFFSVLYKQGCTNVYAENALLTEQVTESRASLRWLWLRRYRSGQTHAMPLSSKAISIQGKIIQIGLRII